MIIRALVLCWALALGGCSLLDIGWEERDTFADGEAGQRLLARGEAGFDGTSAGASHAEDWRRALCQSEEAAASALEADLSQVLVDAWGRAAMAAGNELPVLRQRDLDRLLDAMLARAHLVAGGEGETGVMESYKSLRLAPDLPACLVSVPLSEVADQCALPPQRPAVAGCRDVPEPPERLYYLQR